MCRALFILSFNPDNNPIREVQLPPHLTGEDQLKLCSVVQTTVISGLFNWSPCPQPCRVSLLKSAHVITPTKSFPSLPIPLQLKSSQSLQCLQGPPGPATPLSPSQFSWLQPQGMPNASPKHHRSFGSVFGCNTLPPDTPCPGSSLISLGSCLIQQHSTLLAPAPPVSLPSSLLFPVFVTT